jgi:hypothetical protein
MRIEITYITKKTRETRAKVVHRKTLQETLDWFKWRYGHKILNIKTNAI